MEAPGDQPARFSRVASWRRRLARGRGRWLGVTVAVLVTLALLLPDPGPLPALRYWTFDSYQFYFPRHRKLEPAVIVAIDERSIQARGQWPWPRDLMAELIDRIAAHRPGAICLDILFTEPDRSSPDLIADAMRARDRELAAQLARLRPTDEVLADSIRRARVVIGVAGVDAAIAKGSPPAPARIDGPPPPLTRYPGGLRSLPVLDRAAAGHGLLNADAERGIVRRMPLAASVGAEPMLTLGLEAFRVGNTLPSFVVATRGGHIESVKVGELETFTHGDGSVWLHFTAPDANRFISAVDVLDGKREALERLSGTIVLVGVTALGRLDVNTSPRGDRMHGIEFHAQLVENIVEDALLLRPEWGRYAESAAFALAALLLIAFVPRTRPRRSLAIGVAALALVIAAGVAAFLYGRMLFDPSTPFVGAALLYGLMLSATLVASDVERRDLSVRLAREREAAARVTGELEAARRIQTNMLPTRESLVPAERRIEIFAHMRAAREVGGDLYDFFPISKDKLVVIVGDVSGKGLPAAMFMAVTKALAKSCALRGEARPATLVSALNDELARENPEQMFVTLALLVLDLASGAIEYCNAGHEPPVLVRRGGETITLDDGGGPPLCVMEGFGYEQAHARLEPRDLLVLTSDGVTEAMNRAGALYGRARLRAVLESTARRDLDVTILGNEILAGVRAFTADAEPSDDQTLLLVSWRGSA
ncbi:MAG TPA: SpoIIE family protein phosphatase [Burkholderiales bacterium]|nr:SpoIIE family protein phosphatase [Burkholderiales bacterium]